MTSCGSKMAPTHNLHMNETSQEYICVKQNNMFTSSSKPTLQSVLRGEIPSAYRHLTSYNNYRSKMKEKSARSPRFQHVLLTKENAYIPSNKMIVESDMHQSSPPQIFAPSPSPPSHHSSDNFQDTRCMYRRSNESPSSSSSSSYHEGSPPSFHYYDRSSPVYDSRSSPFRESGSPFLDHHRSSPCYYSESPGRSCSPIRTSNSPFLPSRSPFAVSDTYCKSDSFPDFHVSHNVEDQPMDLSCKSEPLPKDSYVDLPFHASEDTQFDGSLLRNLLCSGKQRSSGKYPGSDRDSPCSDLGKPELPVTSTTRVTLAKKMAYPITSRVSDWLVKIVQFSKSIPEFSNLSTMDKMTLLVNSWTRVLLLLMAENEFEFAVTPLPEDAHNGEAPTQDEPTMKSAESVQSFIKKCKNMSLDQKEFALLRMAVVFNAGYAGLENPEFVEKLNSAVQQLLQQHVTATRPNDSMHYSRLLMLLPSLYGINCNMVENLFCSRINSNMDVLLKEMLHNL